MAAARIAAALSLTLAAGTAVGQSLSVLPVNVFFQPGQRAATLSVTNSTDKPTSIQVRTFDWSQPGRDDQLTPSNSLLASPPLATIPPKSSQVVRLILRQVPQGSEATYRIIVDQIPGPSEAGVVQMVLRLSIPVFAIPAAKVAPRLQFHLERDGEKLFLAALNTGQSHALLRNIVITTGNGQKLSPNTKGLPYLLAGAARRWEIDAQGYVPQPGETLKLTAYDDSGAIDEQIGATATP